MINSYQELAQLHLEHRLVSAAIILPYMGDVVAGSDCYSYCGGVKQMQKAYKPKSTPRQTLPERHLELRIFEGLLVLSLIIILILLLLR
jgi:hypothetical protein